MSSLKLEFSTEAMEYLRPVLRETRTGEETAEAIIPDSTPDVTDVLSTEGMAFLRGRELGEGTASVSVGVSASALVQPEGQAAPEVIEVYIPMSFRFENAQIRPGMRSEAEVQLRRLDSHMVNPRKIMVRASVAVTLQIWEPCREEIPNAVATPDVEALTEKIPLKLMTALGERTYSVEDTVRLTPEGTGQKLAACRMELSHTESRLTGTRAVFRGNVDVTALYLDDNGSVQTGTAQLPFSQYVDLEDCQETDELRLKTMLSGADAELSADGGGINLSLQMLTRAEVWAMREPDCVRDLYALSGQAVPEWESRQYESLLDQQYFPALGRGTLTGLSGQVIHTCCMPGEGSVRRDGETVVLTLPVSVQVLAQGPNGPAAGTLRVELSCTTQSAQNCRFEWEASDLTAAASPGMDGMDVKVTGNLCLRTYGVSELPVLTGGEITEEEPDRDRPGLIIRRTTDGEQLWDVARQYRTTMEAIRSANHLTGELEDGMLLLIPGR